jgi:hypothetical protein
VDEIWIIMVSGDGSEWYVQTDDCKTREDAEQLLPEIVDEWEHVVVARIVKWYKE